MTEEELLKRISTLELEKSKLEGENNAISQELNTIKETFANAVEEHKVSVEKVKQFEAKERKTIEDAAHSFDPKYVVEGKSNDVIQAWIEGYQTKAASLANGTSKKGATIDPPKGTGGQNEEKPSSILGRGF
jgi:predicted nuclease with TOPRIM domain